MNFYNIFSLKYYKMEINLPADIIRYIYKICLEDDPLFIFTFSEEMFQLGQFEPEEKVKMIWDSIILNFNKNNKPLFSLDLNLKDLYNNQNFMNVLSIVEEKIKIEESKYIKDVFCLKDSYKECFNFKIIEWLFKYSNESDTIKQFILNYSIGTNNLEMFKWIYSKGEIFFETYFNCIYVCIKFGNLEILKFLFKIDLILNIINDNNELDHLYYYLFEKGNKDHCLEIFNFLCTIKEPSPGNCYIDLAILNQSFEMVKFLTNKYSKDSSFNKSRWWNRIFCEKAVLVDNLEIFKWLRTQNPPCPWIKSKCLQLSKSEAMKSLILEFPDNTIEEIELYEKQKFNFLESINNFT
jgi:hypothetical protein